MLDMHKLKLKYREMSSQYAEVLKQPVFKTSKRSYTVLPGDTPDHRTSESLVNSADPGASPRIDETNTDHKLEGMTEEDPAFMKTGRLTNQGETFS